MATQRRRRVSGPVHAFIESHVGLGWTPAQIHNELDHWLQTQGSGRLGDRPSLRTVERIVNDLQLRDDSERWSVALADSGEDAALVAAVWAEVVKLRNDGTWGLTLNEARLVARIRGAVPELSGWDAWRLARAYLLRQQQEMDAADLDFFAGSARKWLQPGLDDEERERGRRTHFNDHRALWPDRDYFYSDSSPLLGPVPPLGAGHERLGRGERLGMDDRDADDIVYLTSYLRASIGPSTEDEGE